MGLLGIMVGLLGTIYWAFWEQPVGLLGTILYIRIEDWVGLLGTIGGPFGISQIVPKRPSKLFPKGPPSIKFLYKVFPKGPADCSQKAQ